MGVASSQGGFVRGLIVLFLVLFLFALVLRLDLIFYIAYFLLLSYGLSRWLTHRALTRLDVRRIYADHAFLNDDVHVSIRIRNTTFWPLPWLHVDESVPIELHTPNFVRAAYSLGIRGRAELRYRLSCRRRGYYSLGPLQLSAGDPFGFVQETRVLRQQENLIVYPAVVPLSRLGLPAMLPFGTVSTSRRLFEDPNRLAGVREYHSGDSVRQIHWKATAHADTLLVRRLQPAISQEMAIILDLDEDAYTRRFRLAASEWAIVVAASIAYHLATARQPVGLVTNGHDPLAPTGRPPLLVPPRPGRGQAMQVLELLARIQIARDGPALETLLADTVLPLSWGVTVALITPRTDAAVYRAMQSLSRRGFYPLLLITEPLLDFARVAAQAQVAGGRAYHVWQDSALRLLQEAES